MGACHGQVPISYLYGYAKSFILSQEVIWYPHNGMSFGDETVTFLSIFITYKKNLFNFVGGNSKGRKPFDLHEKMST